MPYTSRTSKKIRRASSTRRFLMSVGTGGIILPSSVAWVRSFGVVILPSFGHL